MAEVNVPYPFIPRLAAAGLLLLVVLVGGGSLSLLVLGTPQLEVLGIAAPVDFLATGLRL